MSDATDYDVVVVGAGLAGLRCAQILGNAGKSVLLVDQNSHLGGRLHSFEIDGYVIDQGFQLINPSYPELRKSGVLKGFDLRQFDPSIQFVGNERSFVLADPRKHPLQSLVGLGRGSLKLRDALALANVLARSRVLPAHKFIAPEDCSTREGLLAAGVSAQAVDQVIQPFLRGTFLDDNLDTSWNYARLVLKSFVKGSPGTHPKGIEELAKAFVDNSTGVDVKLETEVTAVEKNRIITSRGEFGAAHVVFAGDANSATHLLGTQEISWRPQTTWWWSLPKLEKSQALRIDLDDQLLSSALDLSSRAPERSQAHRSLVATPMNGEDPNLTLEQQARASVAKLYGVSVSDVELVTTTLVKQALPTTNAPLQLRSGIQVNGIICAGDYLETPSIQGALASGAKAAHQILRAH